MQDHIDDAVIAGHIAPADAHSGTCVFFCRESPKRLWVAIYSTAVGRTDWCDALNRVSIWEYTDHTHPTITLYDYGDISSMVCAAYTNATSIVIEIPLGAPHGISGAVGSLVYCRVDFDEPRGRRLGRPGDPPGALPYEMQILALPRPYRGPVREWLRLRWDDARTLWRLAGLGAREASDRVSWPGCWPSASMAALLDSARHLHAD